jgi:hypothetical protein
MVDFRQYGLNTSFGRLCQESHEAHISASRDTSFGKRGIKPFFDCKFRRNNVSIEKN